ncbi:hypothetical protein G8A07_26430 [Roseateles sp. DAIF2]|uniref:hypothetical protein n=1 Tax=Roseateles sp. DAIF2 TaxID=2714952 RepID=UPI0018A2CF20|nr:hypothetical protein [Roseateles sp. DAIF2]QPF76115.1 hypothetical protein G8A07_26430 [Roseateles sp. DAIF2]
MIKQLLSSALLAFAAGTAFAAGEHHHEHKPLHGGVVAEASDLDFELVAKADQLALYVRDHGKPAALAGASAKLTLLNGTEKSEASLSPAGTERLEAKGAFKVGAGTKVVALVQLAGKKPVNVRFALK